MKGFFRHGAIVVLCVLAFIAPEPRSSQARNDAGVAEQRNPLTFAERVAYQRAIEEVYWRHRIWPKENARPKPPLDEVMSPAQIEKKVADYLRDSQMLEDQRQRSITPGELQAEVNRMANHTKQSDVLHELFAALGNDPFVIAECLARPILAARLGESFQAGAGNVLKVATNDGTTAAANAYELPEIAVPLDCTNDTWTPTNTANAPIGRYYHGAVWTGSEMIIWGGTDGSNSLNSGGRYNPSTDSWTATSISNAPEARVSPSAVWTGTEMIVWGGLRDFSPFELNTGGKYNPTADSWTNSSTINAPVGRYDHTAVWTGTEMIVWGGNNAFGLLNSGGKYNPETNTWATTSVANGPSGRRNHTSVWTGSEMIVWGGFDGSHDVNSGGRYNPGTDSWTVTNTTSAPSARDGHTAVWTGSEMIIWGGDNGGGSHFNTGGRYNPGTNSWLATSTANASAGRYFHIAVWTGNEMIVWGGFATDFANTGGRYNPGTNSWTSTSITDEPTSRIDHPAIWTGTEMIIWGGYGADGLNTGGRYCAQPSVPIAQSAVSRKAHGSTGSFDVDLPLSGTPGIECRSGGLTNDYTMVITFLANVSVTGNPQAAVTSGIATIGSGGASNGGMVTISGNVVTVPLTNVANAQTISVTLNGVNGSTNVTIPMSVLVGDANGNGAVNASDVSLTKSRIGQAVGATNFRSDVNANGTINASDVSLAKSAVGTALP